MAQSDNERPDPDHLLSEIQRAEHAERRGKLKIFFGASAGVGKTYAMLTAAQDAHRDGEDVVVGLVETHGRKETQALLEGLEILPLRPIDYRGHALKEFDLDAALERKPALILVDELAHSNAPGSRHPRRWQDIQELLAAGINVYTTLNVQHLESLNDVVGGITNIRVSETVPDSAFDNADEVVLVDLPPDELLRRLKEGKVYVPQQAEHAVRNFFRKGNLIALRELALRRTADRVDEDVRAYRKSKDITRVWETRDTLLVCVGPRPGAEKIVRAAARLADRLNADWHAIYVETPRLQRLPEADRQRILKVLALAQELGAYTATISGQDVVPALIDYARRHNMTRLVIGRPEGRADGRRPWYWGRSVADDIALRAEEIDVIQVARDGQESSLGNRFWKAESIQNGQAAQGKSGRAMRYVWTAAACVATAVIASTLFKYFALVNIVMLFLLMVVLTAIRFGRGPAAFAAVVSVGIFDFLFVQPRFSFAVSDVQYLLTFGVMLAVGLITGQLTANLRYQANVAGYRESRARLLYEMARELSGALTTEQVIDIADRFVQQSFRAKAALLLPDASERLKPAQAPGQPESLDTTIAQWAFDHAQPAGYGTDTLPASPVLYLPLKAPMRTRGILALQPEVPRWLMVPEQRRQLDTFSSLIAIALERVHYVEVAQDAVVRMESERLRNSLLSALSHDLRTPLTAMVGLADSLAASQPALPMPQAELAAAMRDETLRMSMLVHNLLDMARFEAGEIKLRLEWQPIEEVVGSALAATRAALARHNVAVSLPRDLPLVQFDAVLIERVLCNLLENAAKYTPAGSHIRIEAEVVRPDLRVRVSDNGPGFPEGQEDKLFEKFTRGLSESAIPGVGLGLAICRTIIEAHGGTIKAEKSDGGGASFVFTLPLGKPPQIDFENTETQLENLS